MIGTATKNKLNTNSSVTTINTTLANTIQTTKIQKNVSTNTIEQLTRKINTITTSLKPYISKKLHDLNKTNIVNAQIIYDYIISEQNELNIKDSTKETKIKRFVQLSNFSLVVSVSFSMNSINSENQFESQF